MTERRDESAAGGVHIFVDEETGVIEVRGFVNRMGMRADMGREVYPGGSWGSYTYEQLRQHGTGWLSC